MRHRTAERKGVAAAELAVLLPFLMFMAIITTDWARCLKMTLAANAAARNGALYASDSIYAANSPYTSTTEAALSEFSGVTPTPTVTQQSSTDSAGKCSGHRYGDGHVFHACQFPRRAESLHADAELSDADRPDCPTAQILERDGHDTHTDAANRCRPR